MSEDIEREAFEVVKWLQASRLPGYEITAIQAAESIKRLMNDYRASNTLIEEQAARIAALMTERTSLIETKREQIESLTKERDRFRDLADGYGKLDADYAIAEARLSEAVKVLESVCAIDAGRAEWHAARQFLATLGEENHDG